MDAPSGVRLLISPSKRENRASIVSTSLTDKSKHSLFYTGQKNLHTARDRRCFSANQVASREQRFWVFFLRAFWSFSPSLLWQKDPTILLEILEDRTVADALFFSSDTLWSGGTSLGGAASPTGGCQSTISTGSECHLVAFHKLHLYYLLHTPGDQRRVIDCVSQFLCLHN